MIKAGSRKTLHRRRMGHLELLIALVGTLVVQSFMRPDEALQRIITNAMLFIVVLSAIRMLSRSRVRVWATLVLGVFAYSFSWVNEYWESGLVVAVSNVSFTMIFLLLIYSLAEEVFSKSEQVETDQIIGAIAIYFLLGLVWAFFYSLIELAIPGSFQANQYATDMSVHSGYVSEFIYFSNVTLTTLGYGDVVPTSRPARLFASLEAMVGQMYIAIVIARLVGLQIAQRR